MGHVLGDLAKPVGGHLELQCRNAHAADRPGLHRTDNTAALRSDEKREREVRERIPAGRWGQPDDIAGSVAFLAGPDAAYINGHVLVVDGGWMAR